MPIERIEKEKGGKMPKFEAVYESTTVSRTPPRPRVTIIEATA